MSGARRPTNLFSAVLDLAVEVCFNPSYILRSFIQPVMMAAHGPAGAMTQPPFRVENG
ncbi:hypothetical protein C8R44DRAFT_759654 [Mycena epipterygia]|nr:hypothetical protein C8R44DRAFT_759654 [Mycena epipterygia]